MFEPHDRKSDGGHHPAQSHHPLFEFNVWISSLKCEPAGVDGGRTANFHLPDRRPLDHLRYLERGFGRNRCRHINGENLDRRLFLGKALAKVFALEVGQAGFQQLAITLHILVVGSQSSQCLLEHLVLQRTMNG